MKTPKRITLQYEGELPKAMVLVPTDKGHSEWRDFWHRKRSLITLHKCLKGMTKRGEIVGWRYIKIHREIMGVPND